MLKQYPLYGAAVTQSKLMVVLYRSAALLVVMSVALALWLSQVMSIAIIINSVINLLLLEYCLRRVPASIGEISFNEAGLAVLRGPNSYLAGDITDNSLVCDWLCLLIIKPHGEGGTLKQIIWQVIWRDMVDDESYRRLSRVVRIKRRLI